MICAPAAVCGRGAESNRSATWRYRDQSLQGFEDVLQPLAVPQLDLAIMKNELPNAHTFPVNHAIFNEPQWVVKTQAVCVYTLRQCPGVEGTRVDFVGERQRFQSRASADRQPGDHGPWDARCNVPFL